MATSFRKATKQQSRLRLTIDGPAGSGKTYTALRLAHLIANGGTIAVIDTERGSASKYVGEAPDGIPWAFDVVELSTYSPEEYTGLVQEAGRQGYAVLIIDSMSHAWEGVGGALDIKDRVGGNSWAAWRQVTPIHNRMIDAILQSPAHVITTMRSRMETVQEKDERGNTVVRRIGMAPVQRAGMEYEFDVVIDIDWAHIATVGKTRCSAIVDMKIEKPGRELAAPLLRWLSDGAPVPEKPAQEERKPEPAAKVEQGAAPKATVTVVTPGNGYETRTRQPWVEDPRAIRAFMEAAMASTSLSSAEILQACKVEDMSEFIGTKAEAKEDIAAWIALNVADSNEPEPEQLTM